MYSDYGIALDRKGRWNFGNDYDKNVIVFGDGNKSSSHADNSKNNYLVLGDICFLTKKIFTFKANNGNENFLTQLCLGSIANGSGGRET